MSDFNLLRRYHQDTRANAQSGIIGLICRKGLGTSRADISGNGRPACEPEFNYGTSEKQDTRTNAQARIIGLICRKGLGTSRADV